MRIVGTVQCLLVGFHAKRNWKLHSYRNSAIIINSKTFLVLAPRTNLLSKKLIIPKLILMQIIECKSVSPYNFPGTQPPKIMYGIQDKTWSVYENATKNANDAHDSHKAKRDSSM